MLKRRNRRGRGEDAAVEGNAGVLRFPCWGQGVVGS